MQVRKKLMERILQNMRFKKVMKHAAFNGVVVDLGCGGEYYFLKEMKNKIKLGIGIDKDINDHVDGNLKLIKQNIKKKINLPSNFADIIIASAFFEHLKFPKEILAECHRILKKDGELIVTIPFARRIIEILDKFHLINEEVVEEHKKIISSPENFEVYLKNNFDVLIKEPFQLGHNYLYIMKKVCK